MEHCRLPTRHRRPGAISISLRRASHPAVSATSLDGNMSGYVGKEKSVGKRYKQHFVFTRLYTSRPCSVRSSTNMNSTLLFYQTCETCGLAPCVHR